MSARERNKGARGELEVVEILRGHRPAVTRNFASGAAGNGDLANGPAGVLIECKRTERFQIRKAWAQASGDAARGGLMPAVATRWNGGPWLAVLELRELVDLLADREGRR